MGNPRGLRAAGVSSFFLPTTTQMEHNEMDHELSRKKDLARIDELLADINKRIDDQQRRLANMRVRVIELMALVASATTHETADSNEVNT